MDIVTLYEYIDNAYRVSWLGNDGNMAFATINQGSLWYPAGYLFISFGRLCMLCVTGNNIDIHQITESPTNTYIHLSEHRVGRTYVPIFTQTDGDELLEFTTYDLLPNGKAKVKIWTHYISISQKQPHHYRFVSKSYISLLQRNLAYCHLYLPHAQVRLFRDTFDVKLYAEHSYKRGPEYFIIANKR